jgi:hypothetical protein
VRLFFKQSVARKAIPFSLVSAAGKTDTELKKTVPWDAPDSYLNNPLHGGKEELHEI